MTALVYIVRHGNTFDEGDTVLRVGARTDIPLSVSGRKQAAALGKHFHDIGVIFDSAAAGPLRRTRLTMEAIVRQQARRPEQSIVPFLREIDYGPDEGKPEEAVLARVGAEALMRWESRAIVPPGWDVDTNALRQAWTSFFANVAEQRSGSHLVVTSNGVARFALPEAWQGDLRLKTGAYGVIRIGDTGRREVLGWNIRP